MFGRVNERKVWTIPIAKTCVSESGLSNDNKKVTIKLVWLRAQKEQMGPKTTLKEILVEEEERVHLGKRG
jgi:hypothetical protein